MSDQGKNIERLEQGIRSGDRYALARAITLAESARAADHELTLQLIKNLEPLIGQSLRLGITGIPGAGKSTWIDRFGMFLVEKGHKVAVLSVDPSSTVSGGSILGDKTRMQALAATDQAYIRPSPSTGTYGGLHPSTRESMLLCEAAGFDWILLETVGVGQSETDVRQLTDLFTLVLLSGGGDDLQAIKRGIMEMADLILINKADGENKPAALQYREEIKLSLSVEGRDLPVLPVSAKAGEGMQEYYEELLKLKGMFNANGTWRERRREQELHWMHALFQRALSQQIEEHRGLREGIRVAEQAILKSQATAPEEAAKLLNIFMTQSPPLT